VWFYLTWHDPRVRGQIAAAAARAANESEKFECKRPCQSNDKVESGGCCDGAQGRWVAWAGVCVRGACWGLACLRSCCLPTTVHHSGVAGPLPCRLAAAAALKASLP
jgi:hypothetical protein